jgi:hypothetical protein
LGNKREREKSECFAQVGWAATVPARREVSTALEFSHAADQKRFHVMYATGRGSGRDVVVRLSRPHNVPADRFGDTGLVGD